MNTICYPRAVVSTLITSSERQRLDERAGKGYRTLHRQTMQELSYDARTGGTDAVVVSVSRCQVKDIEHLAPIAREYPRLPVVALLSEVESRAPQVLLALGRVGVQQVIDVRHTDGWPMLHYVLSQARPDCVHHTAMSVLSETLKRNPSSRELWTFFETLFSAPFTIRTVQQLTAALAIPESTFLSRFYRLRLPHVKYYMTMARLARAAYMLEDRHVAISDAARALGYSSPQSFARHVRLTLRITPTVFREEYDAKRLIYLFRDQLVTPYLKQFQRFTPSAQSTRRNGITKQR